MTKIKKMEKRQRQAVKRPRPKKKLKIAPKKGVKSKENWIFTTFLQQNTTFL